MKEIYIGGIIMKNFFRGFGVSLLASMIPFGVLFFMLLMYSEQSSYGRQDLKTVVTIPTLMMIGIQVFFTFKFYKKGNSKAIYGLWSFYFALLLIKINI